MLVSKQTAFLLTHIFFRMKMIIQFRFSVGRTQTLISSQSIPKLEIHFFFVAYKLVWSAREICSTIAVGCER